MITNAKHEKLKTLVRFMDETLDKMSLDTSLGEYLSCLESIKNASRSIGKIVNETSYQSKKISLVEVNRTFNLKELINHVRPYGEKAGIIIDFDPNLPDFLTGNDHQLLSLLQSVISRGSRMTSENAIGLRCVLDKVDERNAELSFVLTFEKTSPSHPSTFKFDRFEKKILSQLPCLHAIDTSTMNEIRLSLKIVFQLTHTHQIERKVATHSFELNTNHFLNNYTLKP